MNYDMREQLNPRRVTNTMWDFSLMWGHHPGGAFEDFDKITDEALERGFNTIRIETWPWVIGQQENLEETILFPANPNGTWSRSTIDQEHQIALETFEFMEVCKRKGLYMILSTWGHGAGPYKGCNPGVKGQTQSRDDLIRVWSRTLDLMRERDLLSHVIFVDLDQEFPLMSGVVKEIAALASEGKPQPGLAWNEAQLDYVSEHMKHIMWHFHDGYPELLFTCSLHARWADFRAMRLRSFDVLELHIMTDSCRMLDRCRFNFIPKNQVGDEKLKEYQRRMDLIMSGNGRAIYMHELRQRMQRAVDWSIEASAPLVTAEAWGNWWHTDHPDLNWNWLKDWCAEAVDAAGQMGFWGTTPWNFASPLFSNWDDVTWYKSVNEGFLKS